MTSWGDETEAYYRRVSAKLELERTEGMRWEPAPLRRDVQPLWRTWTPLTCTHCHASYDLADEQEEPRYQGLCIGCAEDAMSTDAADLLIREDEDRAEGRRFYGG